MGIKTCTATSSVIVAPTVLFILFPALHMMTGLIHSPVPLIGAAILCPISLWFLFLTCIRDPGVLPRSSDPQVGDPKRIQDVLYGGRLVRLKWCETCHIFRPPRASHCSITDTCIERYDHYCPFIGAAIGKGNYRCFFAFLLSTAILTAFVMISCVIHIVLRVKSDKVDDSSVWLSSFIETPVSAFLIIYTFIACFLIYGLCGFHLYLISLGLTTSEQLKESYPYGNPHSKGYRRNITSMFCVLPEIQRPTSHHVLEQEMIWVKVKDSIKSRLDQLDRNDDVQIQEGSIR